MSVAMWLQIFKYKPHLTSVSCTVHNESAQDHNRFNPSVTQQEGGGHAAIWRSVCVRRCAHVYVFSSVR